jgi:hypothetical protein
MSWITRLWVEIVIAIGTLLLVALAVFWVDGWGRVAAVVVATAIVGTAFGLAVRKVIVERRKMRDEQTKLLYEQIKLRSEQPEFLEEVILKRLWERPSLGIDLGNINPHDLATLRREQSGSPLAWRPQPQPDHAQSAFRIDERVRFTVYRPNISRPEVWSTMLAFAYRAGDMDEGSGDIVESAKQVEQLAAHTLGPQIQGFAALTTESREAVPRAETLRFVPRFDGVEFNPTERSFQWIEKIHQESFRYRVPASLDGQTIRGRMEVYLDIVLIGEVGLALAVDSAATPDMYTDLAAVHGRLYRKIFASYSHKDLSIVEQFEAYLATLGDEFVRDWTHLRSGEVWSHELESMISDADVFQLFWSMNSMASNFVRREWEYALTLSRASFVRPVYWEEPMPSRPELGLPPESLKALHFHYFKLARRDSLNLEFHPTGVKEPQQTPPTSYSTRSRKSSSLGPSSKRFLRVMRWIIPAVLVATAFLLLRRPDLLRNLWEVLEKKLDFIF